MNSIMITWHCGTGRSRHLEREDCGAKDKVDEHKSLALSGEAPGLSVLRDDAMVMRKTFALFRA
jgi:hypothetical protein